MFHMNQLIRSRKVIRDVTYRWIPFLFVFLTVVVSTTLLSTAGHPPRGIVITFGVFAGLLVVIFLACHLMMYCTRIKQGIDAERASNRKDDDDDSGVDVPLGFLSSIRNVETQAPQPRRERPDPLSPGRDARERRRQGQARSNHRISSYGPARNPAAQYNHPPRLSQLTGRGSDRPQSRSMAENRVSQDQQPPTPLDQRQRHRDMRHSSAMIDPLKIHREQTLTPNGPQPGYQRGLGPRESPLRRPLSRDSSSEDNPIIHTTRTSPHTDAAEYHYAPPPPPPPPRETNPRQHRPSAVHAAAAAAPQQQQQQRPPRRDIPDYRPRDTSTEELFYNCPRDGISDIFVTPAGLRRAGTADTVLHARLPFLASPFILPDIKPGARLRRRMSADDCLRRAPWGFSGDDDDDDDVEVMVVRDVGHKVVQVVHPAAAAGPGVERVNSLKGSVRWVRVRGSFDSGYYSAGGCGSGQQTQPSPSLFSQAASESDDLATAFSATATATAVSSRGSSWPPSSGGSRDSWSSSSVVSELLSLRPRSTSSVVSEWTGWRARMSMGDAGAISVVSETRVRRERQGPLGRAGSC
ncbi:hypothetical protein DHEL01_v201583 [Diaporthe helianthi]|uniref:Uncharacterized protein n=1 Tax=Diaporthe helianthi TaxID=158607 RepID=A0A2P5IBY4_DIAHE|nr:hypothetical protein DHEL01_v201583 [Diaporthe helianthi]